MLNIKKLVKKKICTGCGTCAGMCPHGAIEMIKDENKGIYLSQIDKEKCNNCGICLKVCPGISVDFKQFNSSIFGKEPKKKLIGNYLQCYTGHSTNEQLRYSCSSGGVITQLLISLLEKKIIDGALVTRMKKNNPLEPEPFIARTKEEIISARGSKYCPVPVNIKLKEILTFPKKEKFAVVGLPCHIQGIRKVEEIFPELKKKIVLHIGLFCNHTPSFKAMEYLLKMYGIEKKNVQSISYRGLGWPGRMQIRTKDRNFLISNCWSTIGNSKFTPERCKLCIDATAELADISCGDAWLPEFSKDRIGTSIIIARSLASRQILELMRRKDKLDLKKAVVHKVISSQRGILDYKKIEAPIRIKIAKLFSKNNPSYNIKFLNPNWEAIFRLFKHKISSQICNFTAVTSGRITDKTCFRKND